LEFQLYDVTYEDFFAADGISIRLSKDIIKDREIQIARLYGVRPRLIFEEPKPAPPEDTAEADAGVPKTDAAEEADPAENGQSVSVAFPEDARAARVTQESPDSPSGYFIKVKNLVVKGGYIRYPYVFSEKTVDLKFTRISLKARNIAYPLKKGPITFSFSGALDKVADSFPRTRISGKGWVDLRQKDMDGNVALVSPEHGPLLEARIISEDNQAKVEGELNSGDLLQKPRDTKQSQGKMENLAMKALSALGVHIGLRFRFETALDDFRIKNVIFSGQVGKPAAAPSWDQ
jgi:hypothetical protein